DGDVAGRGEFGGLGDRAGGLPHAEADVFPGDPLGLRRADVLDRYRIALSGDEVTVGDLALHVHAADVHVVDDAGGRLVDQDLAVEHQAPLPRRADRELVAPVLLRPEEAGPAQCAQALAEDAHRVGGDQLADLALRLGPEGGGVEAALGEVFAIQAGLAAALVRTEHHRSGGGRDRLVIAAVGVTDVDVAAEQ